MVGSVTGEAHVRAAGWPERRGVHVEPGTKRARDEAVPEVGAWTTTMTEAVPDQIWVRARTTVADLDLRVALGRERREPGRRRRR